MKLRGWQVGVLASLLVIVGWQAANAILFNQEKLLLQSTYNELSQVSTLSERVAILDRKRATYSRDRYGDREQFIVWKGSRYIIGCSRNYAFISFTCDAKECSEVSLSIEDTNIIDF